MRRLPRSQRRAVPEDDRCDGPNKGGSSPIPLKNLRPIWIECRAAEQRTALGRLRGAVAQTEAARTAAPAWVQDLERTGFDPNRIASSLFGSGVPGTRAGAVNEAKAAKGLLGESSEEWSMLRQAAVQRLTDRGANAAKMVKDIGEFTNGRGAGLARELFSPEEIGQLRRFACARTWLLTARLLGGQHRPS